VIRPTDDFCKRARFRPLRIDSETCLGRSRLKYAAYLCPALLILSTAPAQAGELFGGLYAHDVKLPTDKSGIENGMDIQLGYRGGDIAHTPLQPYIFGALNSAGKTSYAAVGLSARFGSKIYVRPGIGLAIHTGSAEKFQDPTNDEVDFGSRVLFEPELAIGTQINGRLSIEASWVHMSHAQLFGRQNPGIDNLGVRLNLAL
jgi:lipid A 3-O-deacylase